MSSNKGEVFLARRGRGKTKIEQTGIVRTLGDEHGSPILRLPKTLRDTLIGLNQDVVIEVSNSNPLNWEIKIKPYIAKQPQEDDKNEPTS